MHEASAAMDFEAAETFEKQLIELQTKRKTTVEDIQSPVEEDTTVEIQRIIALMRTAAENHDYDTAKVFQQQLQEIQEAATAKKLKAAQAAQTPCDKGDDTPKIKELRAAMIEAANANDFDTAKCMQTEIKDLMHKVKLFRDQEEYLRVQIAEAVAEADYAKAAALQKDLAELDTNADAPQSTRAV